MKINGKKVYIDDGGTTPILLNDRTLVPIGVFARYMDGDVLWDEDRRRVTITIKGITLEMQIENNTLKITEDGATKEKEFDVAPIIYNSRTMVPIRTFECFECSFSWDDSGEVTMKYPL